jgi:hypothetical protein
MAGSLTSVRRYVMLVVLFQACFLHLPTRVRLGSVFSSAKTGGEL